MNVQRQGTLAVVLCLLAVAVLSSGCGTPGGGQYSASVTGTLAVDMSGGRFFYEGSPAGEVQGHQMDAYRLIWIERSGPDGMYAAIDIGLPWDIEATEYVISSHWDRSASERITDPGCVRGGFLYATDSEGSYSFDGHAHGTITVTQVGDTISGGFRFDASHWNRNTGRYELATVTGEFSDIPFTLLEVDE